ncbi:MAG TPA: DUF58 domain-containing protein [Abditibacteriaceae bacterium]|jgi:uncharacterized protein (DUF58 family)
MFVRSPQIVLPPLSPARDARSHQTLRRLGLAGVWNLVASRLTPAGRGLLLATGAFFLWGISSLEMQAHVPLLYVACLWVIAFGALRWARPRVALQARHASHVAACEAFDVEIEVQATRALSARVLPLHLPLQFGVDDNGVALPPLVSGETTRVVLPLEAHRRGVYQLQGWRVFSDYPFGILRAWQTFAAPSRLVVTPHFTPLAQLQIVPGRSFSSGGAQLLGHMGESFEFAGNRAFREGDTLRDIDWRATARNASRVAPPVVREWREEHFLRATVVLDTQLVSRDEAGREEFERAVSLCAAVADYLARDNYIVDILAAGDRLYHLQTGPHAAYLDEILDILAAVEPSEEAQSLATLENELAPQLENITAIFVILLDWDEARAMFLDSLASGGAGVRAFVVNDSSATFELSTSNHWISSVPRAAQDNTTW